MPISLIPDFAKIVEAVMFTQMYIYFKVEPTQFGLRGERSINGFGI